VRWVDGQPLVTNAALARFARSRRHDGTTSRRKTGPDGRAKNTKSPKSTKKSLELSSTDFHPLAAPSCWQRASGGEKPLCSAPGVRHSYYVVASWASWRRVTAEGGRAGGAVDERLPSLIWQEDSHQPRRLFPKHRFEPLSWRSFIAVT